MNENTEIYATSGSLRKISSSRKVLWYFIAFCPFFIILYLLNSGAVVIATMAAIVLATTLLGIKLKLGKVASVSLTGIFTHVIYWSLHLGLHGIVVGFAAVIIAAPIALIPIVLLLLLEYLEPWVIN